jgi:alpha-beta hydrolase superfamily lysophospholipase
VQLAFANGERVVMGHMADEEKSKFLATLKRMQERRDRTGRETMVPLSNVLTDPQSAAFYERFADHPALDIEVPLLTVAETIKHKPEEALPDLNVPLLVIGAGKDSVNPPQESVLLFEAAKQPKSLMMLDEATHYELYEGTHFESASSRQLDWFAQYL